MNQPKKEHWRTWYIAVVLALILQIIVYYWFTCYYK